MDRILWIEDNRDYVEIALRAFRDDSFEFQVAGTGREGLIQLAAANSAEAPFQLVILDYQLPDMTGLEVLEEIKRKEPDLPVVILTAHGNEPIAVKAMKLGAYDYFVKPSNGFQFRHFTNVVRRIVEKNRLQLQLERTEGIYHALLESLNAGAVLLDKDGRLRWVNRRILEMSGYESSELLTKNWQALISFRSHDPGKESPPLGNGKTFEASLIRKDGRKTPVLVGTSPFYSGRHFEGYVCVFTDITDRVQMEETLRQSERKYRTLVENSIMNFIILEDTTIRFANQTAAKTFGYPLKELLSGRFDFLTLVAEEAKNSFLKQLKTTLAGKSPTPEFELRLRNRQGEPLYALALLRKVSYEAQPAIELQMLDITARKRAEEETARRERDMKALLQVARVVSRSLDLQEVVQETEKEIRQALPILGVGFLLYRPETQQVEHVYSSYPVEAFQHFPELTPELLQQVVESGKLTILKGHQNTKGAASEESYSTLLLPINLHSDVKGIMLLYRDNLDGQALAPPDGQALAPLDGQALAPLDGQAGRTGGRVGRTSPGRAGSHTGVLSSYPFQANEIQFLEAVRFYLEAALRNIALFQEIKREKEKFESIYRTLLDGVVLFDQQGRILEVNDSALKAIGWKREEVVGRKAFDFIPEDAVQQARRIDRKIRSRGIIRNEEITLVRKDGRRIVVELSGALLRSPSGEIMGFVGAGRDITDKKRLEKQLVQSEKLTALGGFVSGVVHELNNPLFCLLNYVHLLLMEVKDKRQIEMLRCIHKEARYCQQIIRNLQTFAREYKPKKEPVDINQIVQDSVELRRHQLDESRITVQLELAEDLPQALADSQQLQQVFLNLINNARQAMVDFRGSGHLRIKTELVEDQIRILFTDDGPGIAPENLYRIFDPFFSTKKMGQGVGLGLSISHGIVQKHGGKLWVESEQGKGATFIVELPVER